MELDGPPRMVGWITWSGRERSSQTQFLPVPGVRLVHSFLVFMGPHNLSSKGDAENNDPHLRPLLMRAA